MATKKRRKKRGLSGLVETPPAPSTGISTQSRSTGLNFFKKGDDDSVLKKVATWTVAGGIVYFGYRFLSARLEKDQEKREQETEVTKANVGNWAAEKAQRLKLAIEAGFYGGNTDEGVIFTILEKEVGTKEPFAAITDSYKKLTTGRNLEDDLKDNLDPAWMRYIGQTPDWDRANARIRVIRSRSNKQFIKK